MKLNAPRQPPEMQNMSLQLTDLLGVLEVILDSLPTKDVFRAAAVSKVCRLHCLKGAPQGMHHPCTRQLSGALAQGFYQVIHDVSHNRPHVSRTMEQPTSLWQISLCPFQEGSEGKYQHWRS